MEGYVIKSLREEHGLTQLELAKIMGITSQSLSNYENERRVPDVAMLQKLAEYFDVSTDYLLGRTKVKKKTQLGVEDFESSLEFIAERYLEGLEKEIIIKISELPPEYLEELNDFVEYLRLMNKFSQPNLSLSPKDSSFINVRRRFQRKKT